MDIETDPRGKQVPQNLDISLKTGDTFEQIKIEIIRSLTGPATKARTQIPSGYPDRSAAQGVAGYNDPEYRPVFYAEPKIYGDPQKLPRWAEPIPTDPGEREIYLAGLPRYPGGPTGIVGPGVLGKPVNWAADPIVLTVDRSSGDIFQLQILRDNLEWGIPGGMVENQDSHLSTALRELEEETGVKLSAIKPVELYQGPVDDYRNTDTHYIASSVFMFVVPWSEAQEFRFQAEDTDEIRDIRLRKLEPESLDNLFAAHTQLVKLALAELGSRIEAYVAESEMQCIVVEKILPLLLGSSGQERSTIQ